MSVNTRNLLLCGAVALLSGCEAYVHTDAPPPSKVEIHTSPPPKVNVDVDVNRGKGGVNVDVKRTP